jgi:hypothetical protein
MNLKVENISPAGTMACKMASYKMQAVEGFKDPQMKEAMKAFSLMSNEVRCREMGGGDGRQHNTTQHNARGPLL